MKYRPEYDKKLIGKNLRRCRQAKNLSVDEVREYLCIGSIQAIYKWEEGKSYPQTDTMFALMELYGIGLQDLLYKEDVDVVCEIDLDVEHGFLKQRRKENQIRRLIQYVKGLYKNAV